MQTTLTTTPGRHVHPPQPTLVQVRRVGTIDRLALHLGIALIAWGRRPLVVETRERRANRIEQELARREFERAYDDARRLTDYPR